MVSSLSNFVNNIAEGIHKINCKYGCDYKKVKIAESNKKIATDFVNT